MENKIFKGQKTLLGKVVNISIKKENSILQKKFLIPPFSVFDTKQDYWLNRRRQWLDLGIKSELGRGDNLTFNYNSFSYEEDKKFREEKEKYDTKNQGQCMGVFGEKFDRKPQNSTSIFDPVLCEICYKWFCPEEGKILDCFAGGSVRGVVASKLGYSYIGIDLSYLQIKANEENMKEIGAGKYEPKWYCDDSLNVDNYVEDNSMDLLFTCPPYFNLEVYSDKPEDISNMSLEDFNKTYAEILKRSLKKIKDNRFAIIVMGDVRDDKTGEYIMLTDYTRKILKDNGFMIWNNVLLLNSIGTASIRATIPFNANRKLCKIHQNVIIAFKGKQENIKNIFKNIDFNY